MRKKSIALALAFMMIIGAGLIAAVPAPAYAADTLRGLVYSIGNDYIEVTPAQYFQMKSSSNTSVNHLLFDPAGAQPLKALVDTKSMVYTASMYFSAGKNFSVLTDTQQVADLVMRNPGTIALSAAGADITAPSPVFSGMTVGDGTTNLTPVVGGVIKNPIVTFKVDPTKEYVTGTSLLSKDATCNFNYETTPIEQTLTASQSATFANIALDLLKLHSGNANNTGVLGSTLIKYSGLQIAVKGAIIQIPITQLTSRLFNKKIFSTNKTDNLVLKSVRLSFIEVKC